MHIAREAPIAPNKYENNKEKTIFTHAIAMKTAACNFTLFKATIAVLPICWGK